MTASTLLLRYLEPSLAMHSTRHPGRPLPPGAQRGAVPHHHPSRSARYRVPARQRSETRYWVVFLLAHCPLFMAMKASPLIATAHALIILFIAVRCLSFRTPERLIYAMGYIAASEPLWRVGRALIFYETAKYAIAGLSILAIIKYRTGARGDKLALLYFALLLPSIMVLPEFDRRAVSFNLSGPFALAMGAFFFSSQRLRPQMLWRFFLTTLGPILALAFVASFSTLVTEDINFYTSKIASGGLGNNQASSILGLGALIAFAFACTVRRPRFLRRFVAVLGVWFGIQGALTFSRGGVVTALAAIAVVSFFLLQDRRSRGTTALRVGLIALFAVYLAVPLLNAITTGTFERRFTDTHLTGRDKIIEADIMAFRENPLFGVGPGRSKEYHVRTFGSRASTHTEYSRLLAEHGLFGLSALALLAWMAARRVLRSASPAARGLTAGFTVWALLFMFHAAMRMSVVSFVFALGAAHLMAEPTPHGSQRRAPHPSRPAQNPRPSFNPYHTRASHGRRRF